jgi:chondroitin AC lyase
MSIYQNKMNAILLKIFCPAAILLVAILNGYGQPTVDYPAPLRQLHQNVLADILSDPEDEGEIRELLAGLDQEGFWPDIDYASRERGGWPPATHVSRLATLAKAYRSPGSAFHQDARLSRELHQALDYWLDNDLICPNWWYPEIGIPMRLAPTLFLLEDELSEAQMEKAIKILDRAEIGMTGQNKVWLSGNVLMKSLLLRDEEMIRKAAESIREELRAGEGEGIQPDWSFHQHGPQLQFGNYGLSYAGSMIQWIGLLRGTPFAFDEDKVEIVRNYLLKGLQWVSWKDRMDVSACGRQLFPDSPEQKAGSLSRFFQEMETLDPARSSTYADANRYSSLQGHKHFWRSDFQVQRTPGYYFSVKMCSNRVVGAESCNSENLQGYHLGDGAALLYQSGREYENIFPFWDWKKVPGTTTLQTDQPLPVLTCRGYRLETGFVGGVSNGTSGIAVLDYARDGLQAKKSWFLFDGRIACLGAGITSGEGYPVTTSINQVFLSGKIRIKEKRQRNLPTESAEQIEPQWIWHDDTGYVFPDGGKATLAAQTIEGSWHEVAARYPEEQEQADIFRLWLDHGVNPSAQTYAYFILPNTALKDMRKVEKNPPFRILQNDDRAQAVVSADGNLAGIVFYQAGTADVFGGVAVDGPCLVLLQKDKEVVKISVSDPTQELTQIQLSLTGRFRLQEAADDIRFDTERSVLTIPLPAGGEAGGTVSLVLQKL